jgi:hypothetical protein
MGDSLWAGLPRRRAATRTPSPLLKDAGPQQRQQGDIAARSQPRVHAWLDKLLRRFSGKRQTRSRATANGVDDADKSAGAFPAPSAARPIIKSSSHLIAHTTARARISPKVRARSPVAHKTHQSKSKSCARDNTQRAEPPDFFVWAMPNRCFGDQLVQSSNFARVEIDIT